MREVTGDADRSDGGDDSDNLENLDDYEYDDGLDTEPGVARRMVAAALTPAALAIAAVTVATMTLFAPLPTYLATALAISHNQDPLYGERAIAVAQLVAAAIVVILAVVAIRVAGSLDEEKRRLPLMLAGAALLIVSVSVLQAVIGLIVLAHTHLPGSYGTTFSSG
jgi:prepilin signal peptidase PulO-like enzyme (type II secretory pathway)